ncbi:MAG TPA: NAD-dependent epimerase/dehydratase family protein, partial [Bacteroidales bacterium]|nr:NAD-dependent epimerase/dehydratase family protein [Bacteroidales bacterium]
MKILLIGKNSFIGKNFITFSKFNDIQEVDSINLIPEKFNFSKFDVIIHLAAIVHQSKQISIEKYLKVNAEFPVQVAKKAKSNGVKQFIFLSTTKVYGDNPPPVGYWDEGSECNPTDAYGLSKHKAEQELLALSVSTFTVSIVRTPLVYGEGVKANMLSLMKLVNRVPILPFKGINAKRSITFIGNLTAYIDRIIEIRAMGIFLAQDKEPVSVEELVRLIAAGLKRKTFLFNPGKLLLRLVKELAPSIYARLFSSSVIDNSATVKELDLNIPYTTKDGIEIM